MSIRLTCPNGHILNVNDKLAGKSGLCPVCKARVQVPLIKPDDLSEDAILGILASPASQTDRRDGTEDGPLAARRQYSSETDSAGPPKKNCFKCHQEIAAEIHICPYCHTYIANLTDF